ncbi:MAG TPA: PEP-CTERM sorting domain-containing protein [Casimicrobiaceae bacterium]|nr:PEP-CTERM sorting domain-containing protein [Casimicrobiaceae bacterium]
MMKLRTAMQCTAAITILGLGAIQARATVIDYSFSTTVDFSTFSTVQAGETFTISYTVDTSIPPSGGFQIGSTTLADFYNVSNMAMSAGSFSATGTQSLLRQIDDPSMDQYRADSGVAVGSSQLDGLDIVYFTLELFDPTGTAITDATKALDDPTLSGFSTLAFWAVFASGDTGGVIHGQINRPTVPEPATLALLGVGLAGLGISRRRQRSAPHPCVPLVAG